MTVLLWDGTYGYNGGQAHPCVEYVSCPVCDALPGMLCMGKKRRILGRHYERANAYMTLKRELVSRRLSIT